jgi:hypothetical protein
VNKANWIHTITDLCMHCWIVSSCTAASYLHCCILSALLHPICTGASICQGEENDVILLSLVRSNRNGSIGFLSISNRVCVGEIV